MIDEHGHYAIDTVIYTERFLELFTDIIVQLPTRRFFNIVLDDMNFVVRCLLSAYVKSLTIHHESMNDGDASNATTNTADDEPITKKTAHLFQKMLSNFQFYSTFEINDTTGETLSQNELMEKHYEKMLQLQKAIFKHFRDEMATLPLQNIQTIDKRDVLHEEFEKLSDEQLRAIGSSLEPAIQVTNRELLMEILISEHEHVQSHLEVGDMSVCRTH
jgi:intron-binding protein aquarius